MSLKNIGVPSQKRMRKLGDRSGVVPPDDQMSGDLERWFWAHEGPIVHKWMHYFPIYERYFAPFRGKPVRMLEIGVFKGGSLHMWRDYFGAEAVIFGIDIDTRCAVFDGEAAQVRIGSQDDPVFLAQVVEEMGGIDIVLDDGSHMSKHIRASLDVLYPKLSDGGVYMIEDLHAVYWDSHEGGFDDPNSVMLDLKAMVDDLHHWCHDADFQNKATGGATSGLHFYDSVAVLEKSRFISPRHVRRGR